MNNIVEPVLKLYLSFFVLVGLVNSARDLKKKNKAIFFFPFHCNSNIHKVIN